ncbi:MAG: ATP-binding cassette domain-containing protein [Planctomycetes bacterium]|nr:ATP-binding cassette domain-containing protein [Planctomycetota bacterium]
MEDFSLQDKLPLIHPECPKEIEMCLTGIYKSFGEQSVHRNLNLHIERGKITVIVGHSGAGKSVLLKYILGLACPDQGEVMVDGKNIVGLGRKELYDVRANFGVLFQGSALFDFMTVYDNVALPLREKTKLKEDEIRRCVMEKLDLMGMADSIHKFPSELSGGMQKRVGLARALQRDPKIVLFDEPTTGLDPETTQKIYDLFADTQAKLKYTAVIVSHDIPKIFRIADYVAVLHQGGIQACLPPKDLTHCGNLWVDRMLSLEMEGVRGIGL